MHVQEQAVAHTNESWQTDRIIRLPEVKDITGASASSIWRWEREEDFPKRIKIGARMVGWRMSEIMRWIASRKSVNCRGVGNRHG